jgi:hypothetical protein
MSLATQFLIEGHLKEIKRLKKENEELREQLEKERELYYGDDDDDDDDDDDWGRE